MIIASRIRFHVWDHTKDRRNAQQQSGAAAIAQAHADAQIEALWRQRVRENVTRRIENKLSSNVLPFLLRRQAS
jgi:hypothetical protein